MTDMASHLKHTVATNRRGFSWKYWVILAVWEAAAISIAIASVVGGSQPFDEAFVGWTCFFVLLPVLPLLIPMAIQQRIGSAISVVFGVAFIGTILWAIGGYVAVWLAPDSEWAYEWRYSLENDMTGAVFTVDRKPHDCEFLTAPLGGKHCHYEKQVGVVRVRTNRGQRVISFDDGRTWRRDDGSTQPAVWVSWERVED